MFNPSCLLILRIKPGETPSSATRQRRKENGLSTISVEALEKPMHEIRREARRRVRVALHQYRHASKFPASYRRLPCSVYVLSEPNALASRIDECHYTKISVYGDKVSLGIGRLRQKGASPGGSREQSSRGAFFTRSNMICTMPLYFTKAPVGRSGFPDTFSHAMGIIAST